MMKCPSHIILLIGWLCLFSTGSLLHAGSSAPSYNFLLYAGNETNGSADGVWSNATFSTPEGAAVESNGTLFVADSGNCTIRMISTQGVVSTVAGSAGVQGCSNGIGAGASFYTPQALAIDSRQNIYVADTYNNVIRKIDTNGLVTTVAGSPYQTGSKDGIGTNATFNFPTAIAVDRKGNIYVTDTHNYTIRKITQDGVVSTFAGKPGIPGYQDGVGTSSLFYQSTGIAVDGSNNVYVADAGNYAIRKITPSGMVSSLYGIPALGKKTKNFSLTYLAMDGRGNIYYDNNQSDLQMLSSDGKIYSLLSIPTLDDSGNFNFITGIASDTSGNLYLSLNDNTIWNASLIPTITQIITFGKIPAKIYGNPPFNIHVMASSGLPVSLSSSDSNVVTVSNNMVNIVGAGTATLSASQEGDSFFKPTTGIKPLAVGKAAQTIIFGALKPRTFGDAPIILPATSAVGLPLTYISSMTNVATLSNNVLTIKGAGLSTITASAPSSTDYNAASVHQVLLVAKATQTISFTMPSTEPLAKGDTLILAATSNSGLRVSFRSSNPDIISIVKSTATVQNKGKVFITAAQDGDANWKAAPPVAIPLTVQ